MPEDLEVVGNVSSLYALFEVVADDVLRYPGRHDRGLSTMAGEAGICRTDPVGTPARFGICAPPATALVGVPDGE